MHEFPLLFVLSFCVVLGAGLPNYWGYSSPFYPAFYTQGLGYRPYLNYHNPQLSYGWRYTPYGYYPIQYVTANGTEALTEVLSKKKIFSNDLILINMNLMLLK